MSKYKVLVAGCGSMAGVWVSYAKSQPDISIVGLLDINRDAAKNMIIEKELVCQVYTTIDEALQGCKPDIVFDVTIPSSHHLITLSALKYGCHVFGEKPMSSGLEQAKEMVDLANKSGKTYAVMQNRRFLSGIRAYRELIASGEIGIPGYMCADFFLGPHFGGFRDLMESPLVLDMAIHTFDQARFIIGSNPVSVYCQEFNPQGSWYKGDASAICIFEFANGVVFCYRGSWCAEGYPTSWESDWKVIGSKGTALWDGTNPPKAQQIVESGEQKFFRDVKTVELNHTWAGREGHEGCLDEMFRALEEKRKAETDCTDNIHSVAMVFAAIESSKRGEKVVIKTGV